jgi:hypothetical protein
MNQKAYRASLFKFPDVSRKTFLFSLFFKQTYYVNQYPSLFLARQGVVTKERPEFITNK